MTVGSIVYATKSGLGILAKTLYDYNIINKVHICEHNKFESNFEWYKKEDVFISKEELLKNIDTLFILEAPLPDPFDWSIVEKAKDSNKNVVLMPMYESTPRSHLVFIDKILCPSKLDLEYYEDYNSCVVDVPCHQHIRWQQRKQAKVFIHNAGHGGIFSRNGTEEIIKSLQYIKSNNIEIIIRIQPDADIDLLNLIDKVNDKRVKIEKRHVPFEELWCYGDVFLFPEKFNGLSLPLQEAFSSGMLVMAGDRFPINSWLPKDPLIEVSGYFKTYLPWIGIKIDNAIIEPENIAKHIDKFAYRDITKYSELGKVYYDYMTNKSFIKNMYDKEIISA